MREAEAMGSKPLCIELFCGMFGWSAGWLELGGRVVGFDIEHLPHHGPVPSGAELVLQDVRTLHGSQFRDADLILASPPCQSYSYRAMPWKRAKSLPPPSNELFEACFRIQREACEAAGRYIPMVVENVRGAQPWVGHAQGKFGSFYLWGDVPAIMPRALLREKKTDCSNIPVGKLFRETGERVARITTGHLEGRKVPGINWSNHGEPGYKAQGFNVTAAQRYRQEQGIKQEGSGAAWFDNGLCRKSSKSDSRKAASAQIAKIPLPLSQWIAQIYYPR